MLASFAAFEERVPEQFGLAVKQRLASEAPPGTPQAQTFFKDFAQQLLCQASRAQSFLPSSSERVQQRAWFDVRPELVEDREEEQSEPLLLGLGGLPCIAWSKVSLRRQGADPSELAFQLWLAGRRQFGLDDVADMFMFENVADFVAEDKIRQPLAETHDVIILGFRAEDTEVKSEERARAPQF